MNQRHSKALAIFIGIWSAFILTYPTFGKPNTATTPTNCYNLADKEACTSSYQMFCNDYNQDIYSSNGCSKWGLIRCNWVTNKEDDKVLTWCTPTGKIYKFSSIQ